MARSTDNPFPGWHPPARRHPLGFDQNAPQVCGRLSRTGEQARWLYALCTEPFVKSNDLNWITTEMPHRSTERREGALGLVHFWALPPDSNRRRVSFAGDFSRRLSGRVWQFERPDFAAQRRGMSTGNPYLVLKDVGRMLVARLPDHLRHELRPVLAVGRMPDITPVFRWVIRPAAKHPHAAAIHNRRKPQPGRPAGALRHLLPRFAVGRRPHIVEGVILRNVIAAAKNVERVIEHNGLMVCPRRPAGSRRFLRPYLTVRRRPHIILEALVVAKVIIL